MPLLLAASLFFTTPAPLDLPRAEAFLVKDGDVRRLEDRYNTFDLWTCRAVVGRWFDDERSFVLSRLDVLPPALLDAPPETREDYAAGIVKADPKEKKHLVRMVDLLSPVEPPEKFAPPRQMPHGYKDVRYCHGTNTTAIVCAFRPEKSPAWYLASWELAADDDFDEKLAEFEKEFLSKRAWEKLPVFQDESNASKPPKPSKPPKLSAERELLRADVCGGVAAYENWHATDSADFVIVDDLGTRNFTVSLTNDLPRWRARFVEVLPTPIDGTNVLAVARIYKNRDDYLDAAGDDMAWSAAYWSPMRRELVACLPADGTEELRKTIHHESFHQYLSYATAMIATSPWLNEGYAQYFEDGLDAVDALAVPRPPEFKTPEQIDKLATALPAIFAMDYKQFYDGTDAERRKKYRLAWSIAVFIEKGAPLVRFAPFKDLKRDYVEALLKTHDMREATDAAFGSADKLAHFVTEWKRFWKNQ